MICFVKIDATKVADCTRLTHSFQPRLQKGPIGA